MTIARAVIKTCEFCGNPYEVPGKTKLQRKRTKRRMYCTTDCANKAAAANPGESALVTNMLLNTEMAMRAQNVTVFGVELRKAEDP